jgi:GTP:adenosylcobinamide-phosphate guanylyltransferase
MKVDAVVLAGGDGAVIDPDSRFKGLLTIAGKPMIEWVVEALKRSESVAEVAVVVPTAEDLGGWVDMVDKLVISNGSFIENGLAGIRSFRDDRPALAVTGDIPALTPEAIDDFVTRSLETGADFTYPLIPKEAMLEQFPGSERTYVKLVDGKVTGGNMMIVNPYLVEQNALLGQALFDTRKSAVQMARIIGFRFVAKLVLGRLDVPEVEAKLGEILGGTGAAVYTTYASIAADVDKPVDVEVAERVLYGASSGRKDTLQQEVDA